MSSPTGWIQIQGAQLWLDAEPTLSVLRSAEQLAELRGQPYPQSPDTNVHELPVAFTTKGPELDALLCGSDLAMTWRSPRRLAPLRSQTLPLARWQTRGGHLEARLKIGEQHDSGSVSTLRPQDARWTLPPQEVARGLIRAAYDLRGTDLNAPGVITHLGTRAQMLGRCAARVHDSSHHWAVSGGHALVTALIASRWVSGEAHMTLSRRELLHGVITLNLISALPTPRTAGERTPLLHDTLLWERVRSLTGQPNATEPLSTYLSAAAQLQRALPGISLHRPGWNDQLISCVGHMNSGQRRDPAELETLEIWWQAAPVTSEFPELGEERRLNLSAAPLPWPGQWNPPGQVQLERETQRAAAALGVLPGQQLQDYRGWLTRDGGVFGLYDLSALRSLSPVTGPFVPDEPFPQTSEQQIAQRLSEHLRPRQSLWDIHTRDWQRALAINQAGTPLPGYETLHDLVALSSERTDHVAPEAGALRRLPELLRRRINTARLRDAAPAGSGA